MKCRTQSNGVYFDRSTKGEVGKQHHCTLPERREIARNRGRSYYVKCHVCGFEGKHRESGSRAVANWNEGAMEGKE